MTGSRWALGIAALMLSSAPRSVAGFETPESAKYDPDLDVWYVANINGSSADKDGNGYLSRLHADGSVDAMKWIAGGAGGVTLMGAQFLNDVAVGPDGLYVTDTGVRVDAKGMSHPGPDRVYRIAPDRSESVALETDSLAGPNGITWDVARKQFIIVPFFGTVIRAWTPGSKATIPLGTSWADSSLNVLENGTLTPVAGDLPSPADIGLDLKRGRVAIPLLKENRVEFRTLPTAERATP